MRIAACAQIRCLASDLESRLEPSRAAEENRGQPPTPNGQMWRLAGRLPKLAGGAAWQARQVETVDPEDKSINTAPTCSRSDAAPIVGQPDAARS